MYLTWYQQYHLLFYLVVNLNVNDCSKFIHLQKRISELFILDGLEVARLSLSYKQ